MTVIVKTKTPLTVPETLQRRAGFKAGDRLEFEVSAGVIRILPKTAAGDEYTPEQRRLIDAGLAEGLADIKRGRVHGPFDTHKEMMDSLQGKGKRASKTSKRPK